MDKVPPTQAALCGSEMLGRVGGWWGSPAERAPQMQGEGQLLAWPGFAGFGACGRRWWGLLMASSPCDRLGQVIGLDKFE